MSKFLVLSDTCAASIGSGDKIDCLSLCTVIDPKYLGAKVSLAFL